MKERRLAREVAMQVLFQWEAQGLFSRHHTNAVQGFDLDIEGFLHQFIDIFHTKRNEKIDQRFAAGLLRGSIASLHDIDALIEDASTKWKLSRMDAIDRAILRLSCFELAFKKEASANIIINEAIEIAKRYGSEQSSAFINGILDTIKDRLNEKIHSG